MKLVIALALIFKLQLLHPIHVSVTEIEYDEKEQELEIMTRIFVDDLETAIRLQRNKPDLDILNPPPGLTREKIIGEYIGSQLSIRLDNKQQAIRYLGQELEGEAVICYLIVSNIKRWRSIEIKNGALQELFDDQSNIVHVTVGENIKSMRLVKDKSSGSLSFDSE